MATSLDLQEQEQIDDLKAFWKRYGNWITWLLIAVLAGFAGWNGWNWYQREQAVKAGALFDELDRTVLAGDVDRAARVFGDLRDRYPGTAWTAQAGLVVARLQHERAKADDAIATLAWVAEKGADAGLQAVARLRLAGLHLEAGRHDAALQALAAVKAPGFDGLVADRRGDVLKAQGKPAEAVEAYRSAHKALAESSDYRRVVEAKLTALGVALPATPAKP
jgi:predicted negative regulator of RcsB-dependent stress response